ncbi:hypothetical protein FRC04_005058 [Tulasnella sp. 424]|nr:hypothetical protein FRC04_005058 [Tulasnella sp. 424]KAG8962895.1 hypothetical protein FRC05_005065 [Tulasnella sp. 425]
MTPITPERASDPAGKNTSVRMKANGAKSHNAVTQATNISEVVETILESADWKSLASCARVNRWWSEQALDRIWSEVPSFFPLMELLATLRYTNETGWRFASVITAEALGRFYFYTIRIRSLTHDDAQNEPSSPPAKPRRPPFPAVAPQVLGLFSSTVKALELELRPFNLYETQMVFQSLALRDLGELEKLLINTTDPDNNAFPAICTMLVECSRLKSLSLTMGSGIHPRDMRQIERLHNLRYLYIFPGILFKDKDSISQGFQTLVDGCPDLEHLLTGMTYSRDGTKPASYLELNDIRPLLRLVGLKTLILQGGMPVVLRECDVAEMGRSWCSVRSISLCACPWWPSQAPGTSLELLASFKKTFPPTLQKLGLFFEVPGSDVLRRHYPEGAGLDGLKVLSTGHTRSSGDMLDTSYFLGHMLRDDVLLLSNFRVYSSGRLDAFPEAAATIFDDPWWFGVRETMRLAHL